MVGTFMDTIRTTLCIENLNYFDKGEMEGKFLKLSI